MMNKNRYYGLICHDIFILSFSEREKSFSSSSGGQNRPLCQPWRHLLISASKRNCPSYSYSSKQVELQCSILEKNFRIWETSRLFYFPTLQLFSLKDLYITSQSLSLCEGLLNYISNIILSNNYFLILFLSCNCDMKYL